MLGHKGKGELKLNIHSTYEILSYWFFSCPDCVHLLLAHNAAVKVKNSLGWNPLAEAISYGDRHTSLCKLYSKKL